MFAGFVGGVPNTTYGENVGVLAITKVFNTSIIRLAATFAILLSMIPKFGALISTIPVPVMGGVCIVLFGIITSSGLRTLVDNNVNFGEKKNMIIASVVLVLGIGGAMINLGEFVLQGMGLAIIVGVLLNILLDPDPKEGE